MQTDTERHLSALQGDWEQVGLEADGIVDPPDEHGAPGALTLIRGNHFSVRTPAGDVLLEGSFELDATTDPKSITWIDSIGADAGKHLPAIYTLANDRFVFIAADEGMPRPGQFHTMLGQTMRSFIRRS